MRSFSILLAILLQQSSPVPEGVRIETTMKEVSAWPEFQRVEPTVGRLDKAMDDFILGFPPAPLPEPKFYGADVRDAARRRARDLLFSLVPESVGDSNQWREWFDLPDKVSERFGVSLARGTPAAHSTTGFSYRDPRAGVDFRVVDGVAVPIHISIQEREPCDWLPKVRDRESWERLASEVYRKAFGTAPFGDPPDLVALHPDQVEFRWRDRWHGLPLPHQYNASVRIQEYSPTRKWSLTLERGADEAAVGALKKSMSGLSFKVTPREAVAIAARNWRAARPDQSTDVGILGVSFMLFSSGDLGGSSIGAINRHTYYSDPETAKRLLGGEPVLGMWVLTLHGSGWLDKVTVWVAADTGRVTKIYGPQGLVR